jgi:hypothetical protein
MPRKTRSQRETVREKVYRWTRRTGTNQHLLDVLALLELLASELYVHYQPFPEKPPFLDRLASWLACTPRDVDQRLLFEFVPWLLFVGPREMDSMYRAAFTGPIMRWIVEQSNVSLSQPAFSQSVSDSLKRTYVGSMAGMDIGTFCRVNNIVGQTYRCDFRALAEVGSVTAFRDYLRDNNYERIIAVEDYVGTGSQMSEAVVFLRQLTSFPVLLCPIIVANAGNKLGAKIQRAESHITYSPQFITPSATYIPKTANKKAPEPQCFRKMRNLLTRLWGIVRGTVPTQPLYSPFGFGDVGSLVLTFLNCPDNVPPLLHHKSDSWDPLFMRSSREG